MSDDVGVNQTASYTVAADVSGTVAFQRVKIQLGNDGDFEGDVGSTSPLPVSGTVQVSGTVTAVGISTQVSGTVTVNTIAAGFSVNALVTGVVSVSVMPAVSGTISVLGVVPVTTAASVSVTALPVWMNPTQAVVVNTIAAGFSVNALVTGVVSVSVMPAVSISVSAVLGTVITVLGTLAVSQTTVVSGTVAITIPVSQTVGTIVTILGTQVVTLATGGTIATLLGTVMAQINFSTTAAPSVSATGVVVWNVGMAITTATPSAAGTGQVIWVANTGAIMTTTAVSGSTGPVVWLGASQTFAQNAGLPLLIMVSSTAGAVSMSTYLFTMWTGGNVAAAATTQFAVPAGKRFRIMNIQAVINSSAVTGGTVIVAVIGATASASLTSGSVATQAWYRALQVLVSAGPINVQIGDDNGADIVAATTFAICAQGSTAYQIGGIIIQGNIF